LFPSGGPLEERREIKHKEIELNFPPFQLFSLLWRRITNQKPVCWLVIIDFQLYLSALLVALNYSHKVSFVNMKQVNSLSPSPSNCTNSFPVKRIWQRLEMLSLSLSLYIFFISIEGHRQAKINLKTSGGCESPEGACAQAKMSTRSSRPK
jgi:hypothetical protein